MADPLSFIADPVLGKHAVSPLDGHYEKGEFGALLDTGPGVTLTERFALSISEIVAWRGKEGKCRATIKAATGLTLKVAPGSGSEKNGVSVFNIAPGRWLVSGDNAGLVQDLHFTIENDGTIVDLSHGRTVIRIDGAKSRWVLSKLFAIDFSDTAFTVGDGLSTAHHDILAQIQRTGPDAFDIYVFRSFARSFWHLLSRSAQEVGYRVD